MNSNQIEFKYLNLFQYYAIICALLKWIAMYRDIRNGVIVAVFVIIFACLMLVNDKFIIRISNRTNVAVIGFLIYNVLLALISFFRGYSLSLIFSEAANTLVPIFLYFIAIKFSDRQAKKFELFVMFCGIVVLITGIYYNIGLNDPFYLTFIAENNPNFSMHGFTVYPRLNSFFGSVVCGTLGCLGTCLSFSFLNNDEKIKFWIFFVPNFLLALLTLQRSAMICVIIVTFILILRGMKKGHFSILVPIGLALILVTAGIIISIKMPNVYYAIFQRFNSVSSAVSERNSDWSNAFGNGLISTIIGYGFGTGGQRAIGLSLSTVNDGNYFKMIYECGIIGFLMFIYIIINTLKKVKKYNIDIVYVVAVVSCMLQMIGSNILTFQFTASLFWYVVGRINKETCFDPCDGVFIL